MLFKGAKTPGNVSNIHLLELTRRNLTTLLAKLDDPLSARTLMDGEDSIMVRAVEDGEDSIIVRAVEDEEHYSDRPPGPIYMPSSGEIL